MKVPLEAPIESNPCSLGHEMKFRAPETWQDVTSQDWGHYRRDCKDRVVGFVPWRPGASPAALLAEVGLTFEGKVA